ncbi:MAG TPA: ABC transporter substrate-binding protein [Alphaproteobacteria bacterium]
MIRRHSILALALALGCVATGVQAQSAMSAAPATDAPAVALQEGSQFVTRLASRAIAELTTDALPAPERIARFRAMLTEAFDVPGIGRFVLGRYWRTATEAERAEYLKLFEDLIVQTYANRFQDFAGAQLRVLGTREGQDGDVVAMVEATLPGKPPARLDVRMRRNGGGFKIFDVLVEGISMSVTQRDEFAAVVQRNGGKVEGLLASLRERTRARQ